jgi:DnaJ like chaperone protein
MDLLLMFVVIIVLFYVSKSFMNYNVVVQSGGTIDYDSLEVEAKIIVALMSKVAKADGKVSELEAELLSNTFTDFASTFENSESMREELKSIYYNEKDLDDNTTFLTQELYKLTRHSYAKRIRILEYLLNMAFIDLEYAQSEEDIIITIAENLEIKQEDFMKILNAFKEAYATFQSQSHDNLDDAYKTLGVTASDDLASVKKAYRKLVKENHPDIISGKGLGEDEIQKATIRLQEINAAYDLIKTKLGA